MSTSNNTPSNDPGAIESGSTSNDTKRITAAPVQTSTVAELVGGPAPVHPHAFARAMAKETQIGAFHLRDTTETYAIAWAREQYGPLETETTAKLGARQAELAEIEKSLDETRKAKRDQPKTKPSGQAGAPWHPLRKIFVIIVIIGLLLWLAFDIRQVGTYVFATVPGVTSLLGAVMWVMGAAVVAWAAKTYLGMIGAYWRKIIVGTCAALMVLNFIGWAWAASHTMQEFGKEAGSGFEKMLSGDNGESATPDESGHSRWFFFFALCSIPLSAVVGAAFIHHEMERHAPPEIPNVDRTRIEARENALRTDRLRVHDIIVPLTVRLRECREAPTRLATEAVTIFDLERAHPGSSRELYPGNGDEPPGSLMLPASVA